MILAHDEDSYGKQKMVIVLIKWKVRPQQRDIDAFLTFWNQEAIVQDRRGLIGEFLSEVETTESYPYITWDVGEEKLDAYKVYVNVGMWADATSFHEQIAQYFNDEKPLKGFEVERRIRTVLLPRCWRMGDALLPIHDSGGVL